MTTVFGAVIWGFDFGERLRPFDGAIWGFGVDAFGLEMEALGLEMDFLILTGLAHIILFLIALILIWKSAAYSRKQKILQTLIAWFIPLVGPIIPIAIHVNDRNKERLSERYLGQSVDESKTPLGGA